MLTTIGVGAEQRGQLASQSGQTVGFDAEKDDVGVTDCGEVADHLRPHLEITFRAHDAKPALLHRSQVRSAREQHHVRFRARQPRADVAANRAGAGDDDSHDAVGANACATTRR